MPVRITLMSFPIIFPSFRIHRYIIRCLADRGEAKKEEDMSDVKIAQRKSFIQYLIFVKSLIKVRFARTSYEFQRLEEED